MKLPTLDSYNFKGKRVLVRSDLNSPVKNGKVMMNDRIKESSKTILELKRKKARVVVIAHQSQPGKEDFISLEQHAKLLNQFVKVKFIKDIIGKKAIVEITNLKDCEVLLLENIRFEEDEFDPSANNKIVKTLAPLFDYYVNDAFSVCHRKQTSIVSFPRVLKSCVGRTMENELKHLEKITLKNCLFILGGAKFDETIKFIDGKRKILSGGLLGPLILVANGQKLGETEKYLGEGRKYLKQLKNPKNVFVPIDFAVQSGEKRKELMLDEFPSKFRILDIGEKSIEIFVNEIKKANAVFVKGPQGKYEDEKFAKGTKEVLKAVSECKFSFLGGGHTSSALEEIGFSKKDFNYVSLSGGATVEYILGKKLPGIEAIRKGK